MESWAFNDVGGLAENLPRQLFQKGEINEKIYVCN